MFKFIWKIIAIIVLLLVVRYFYRIYRNHFSKIIECKATVLSKDLVSPEHYNDSMDLKAYQHYYITFMLESDHPLTLEVDQDDYHFIKEGTTGILSYQGKRYIEFK